MPDDVTDAIEENAQAPRRISADGVEAEEHPLQDQIAADRYVDGKTAMSNRMPTLGLRQRRIIPPGAV